MVGIRAALTSSPFTSMVLKDLFQRRSANNHGYLATVLKAESVITVFPGKPIKLGLGTWSTIELKLKPGTKKGKAKDEVPVTGE